MNNKPKVSVIIAVYNCEVYIGRMLLSMARQSFRDFEIIIINDGSTDETQVQIDRFIKQEKEIPVYSYTISNSGAGVARNEGMKYAKGDYWVFLDADDECQPDMLLNMLKGCEEHDADVCVVHSRQKDIATGENIDRDESVTEQYMPSHNPFVPEDASDSLFCLFRGWAWDKMISAKLIKKNSIKFFDGRTSEDLVFTYMALACAHRIYVSDYVGYTYYINNSCSVSGSRMKYWRSFYDAMIELKRQMIEKKLYDVLEMSYLNWASDFVYWWLLSLGISEAQYLGYTLLYKRGYKEIGFDKLLSGKMLCQYTKPFIRSLRDKNYFSYVRDCTSELTEENCRLKAECNSIRESTQRDMQVVKSSLTWKVGDCILKLPKKIADAMINRKNANN